MLELNETMCFASLNACDRRSRITVVTMAGAAIAINDAAATDTVLSIKQRVFAANKKLNVHRQRLVYSAGPHGIDALADDETLGGAGVAGDGSAKLDVLMEALTEAEKAKNKQELLSAKQELLSLQRVCCFLQREAAISEAETERLEAALLEAEAERLELLASIREQLAYIRSFKM
jgi:hypothetical protein